MSFPKVYYIPNKETFVKVGLRAIVCPLDHPDTANVTGDGKTPVLTSPVRMKLPNGEFFTTNTHYLPNRMRGN
jgi:hypothetical protein